MIGLFWAALALPVLAWLAVAGWIDRFGRTRPKPSSEPAVVVLGAKVQPDGRASPALERRVETAAALYRERLAPLLVFSGGAFGARPSEARVAQQLALAQGVPASACLLEEASHTTKENARFTAELLRARGIQQVLLVSDGYHLLRARLLFAREGLAAQPVASRRQLSASVRLRSTLREALAFLRALAG